MKAALKASVVIVGVGRVGSALRRAWRGHFTVHTRRHDQALALHRVADGTWVFMCVPEAAWSELAPELEQHTKRLRLVSVSGSLAPADFTALDLERVETFHPLMTFVAGELTPLRDVPIGISSPALRPFVRAAGGRAFALPDDRALYHAGAVTAAAGVVATFALACELLRAAGVTDAGQVLAPMSLRAIAAAAKVGARQALTGPVARGDEKTLARHRQALSQVARDDAALYEALVAAMRRLRKSST